MQSSPSWTSPWGWRLGLALAILLGAILRLIWVQDMEYKADEAWSFERTQQVGVTESFPWLGMPTSAGFRNPGMSVWVFLALGKLSAAADPPTLARAVQLLNVAALVFLVWFACRMVPSEEREPWLWAAALGAANPLAVVFQRKIWPPSVLPLLTLLMLAGWWRRERRWGAFTWGLLGICLGQIHMAGFFFAGGFLLWAVLFDRRRVAWWSWLSGSCLGALPLIPWLQYLWTERATQTISAFRWYHVLDGQFWMRWFVEPFGISLEYALKEDFRDFLGYPLLNGHPTYLGWLLHGLIIAAALVILGRAGYLLWQSRCAKSSLLAGKQSPTAFTQNAALWGFGLLLTSMCMPIHRHYLMVAFPLGFVWLARLALAHPGSIRLGRVLLVVLCVCQLSISATFLGYIHANQRVIRGGYWMPYGCQESFRVQSPWPDAVRSKSDCPDEHALQYP